MNAFINAITDPRLLFMWFSFIFLALASLLLGYGRTLAVGRDILRRGGL